MLSRSKTALGPPGLVAVSRLARKAREADLRDPGRPPKTIDTNKKDIKRDVDNNNTDVNVTRPTGNSRAKALRRLRDPDKGRPDIHARVLAGEITATRRSSKMSSA